MKHCLRQKAISMQRVRRGWGSDKSYMLSVLSMSHARLHWPLEFLWRATLSRSISSRSLFHRRYSSCSSFDVGTFRSVLLCGPARS